MSESDVSQVESLQGRVSDLESQHLAKRKECHDLRNQLGSAVASQQLHERLAFQMLDLYDAVEKAIAEGQSLPASIINATFKAAGAAKSFRMIETRRLEKGLPSLRQPK